MDENAIPILRPGETAGPFEIIIPREFLFYEQWMRRTTRWERFLMRAGLMRKARRRELAERFRPWFDKYGWRN